MLKDPFGGWDIDGIKQLGFTIGMICLVLSFASSTSGEWYDPYIWVYGILTINPPLTIIIFMVGILALWWHEQFSGGLY